MRWQYDIAKFVLITLLGREVGHSSQFPKSSATNLYCSTIFGNHPLIKWLFNHLMFFKLTQQKKQDNENTSVNLLTTFFHGLEQDEKAKRRRLWHIFFLTASNYNHRGLTRRVFLYENSFHYERNSPTWLA